MEAEDLNDWILCRRFDETFYKRFDRPLRCILCAKDILPSQWFFTSTFWEVTKCWGGHAQGAVVAGDSSSDHAPGVCATCETYFALNVIKGRLKCEREGCRRVVRVNEALLKLRVEDSPERKAFLELVAKCLRYECIVLQCDEPFGPARKDRIGPAPGCDHDRNCCDSCLAQVFETAINDSDLGGLVCPEPDCRKAVINRERIRELVSTVCFRKYCKLQSYKLVSSKPNFRWCSCGEGQLHQPGADSPEWKCTSCTKRHCFICRDLSTATGTCEHLQEIDRRLRADRDHQRQAARDALAVRKRAFLDGSAETERQKIRITKKCPKVDCGNRIERAGGCNHMQCDGMYGCGTHFCWICKVIWREGGSIRRHLDSCDPRLGTEANRVAKEVLLAEREVQELYADGWDEDPGYDKELDKDDGSLFSYR